MCFVSAKTVSNDITEKQVDETCVVSEVKKNPGLWQKVKDVFKKIVDDIKRKLEMLAKRITMMSMEKDIQISLGKQCKKDES